MDTGFVGSTFEGDQLCLRPPQTSRGACSSFFFGGEGGETVPATKQRLPVFLFGGGGGVPFKSTIQRVLMFFFPEEVR